MTRRLGLVPRLLAMLGVALAGAAHTRPVLAQQSGGQTVQINVDAPIDGTTITNGSSVDVGGWAADTAGLAPGAVAMAPGVDQVQVYLDGTLDGGGTLLGSATYGEARPDVGAALGSAAYSNSGYNLDWEADQLSPGPHTLYVYAHSQASGWWDTTVSITVQGAPTTASSGTSDQSDVSYSSGGMSGGPVGNPNGIGTAAYFSGLTAGGSRFGGASAGNAYAAGGYGAAGAYMNGAGANAYAQGYGAANPGMAYASQAGSPYGGGYSPQMAPSYPTANANPYAYSSGYANSGPNPYPYGYAPSQYPQTGYAPYGYGAAPSAPWPR